MSNSNARAESGPETSRITVLVGDLLLDVSVPTDAPLSAVTNDVIELANEELAARGNALPFDNTESKWTLAHADGPIIDSERSLAEAGVGDGELLAVHRAAAPTPAVLVDRLTATAAASDPLAFGPRTWFALGVTFSVSCALLFNDRLNTVIAGFRAPAIAMLIVGAVAGGSAAVVARREDGLRGAAWLTAMALPLFFAGALHIIPEASLIEALPMAMAVTALAALLQNLASRRGRAAFTAVTTLAVLGGPVAVANLLWQPTPRASGAALATVAIIALSLASRVTIGLSGMPIPRVPTAGEPLDDIETQGGIAVDGVKALNKQVIPGEGRMSQRVHSAREHLTGIVAGATTLVVIGGYLAVDVTDGFYWQGTVFALVIATLLCLRGRNHHDLVQSAILIAGGLVMALAVCVKTATFVEGWQFNAALGLVILTVLLTLCGLAAPRHDFTPVVRRRVELLNFATISMVFPLCMWILGAYAYFRELEI